MLTDPLLALAADTLAANRAAGRRVATAESCTGGLVMAALTALPGSSDVVEAGFVTYANAAKTQLLGVDAALIAQHGAVSAPVARVMAAGALARCDADVAVAITGVAGPGGGSPDKPVGLVVFARAWRGAQPMAHHVQRVQFRANDRTIIRLAAAHHALTLLQPAADILLAAPDIELDVP